MRIVFLLLMLSVFFLSCTENAKAAHVYVIGIINFPAGCSEERSDILTQKVVYIIGENIKWNDLNVKKQFNVFSGVSQQSVTSLVIDINLTLNKQISWAKLLREKTGLLKDVYVDFVEVKQLENFGIQLQLALNNEGDEVEQLNDFITALKGIKTVQTAIQTSPIHDVYRELRIDKRQLKKYGVKERDILECLSLSSLVGVSMMLDHEDKWINRELPIELLLPNLDAVKVLNSNGEKIPVSVFATSSLQFKDQKSVSITLIPTYKDSENAQDLLGAVMQLSKDFPFDLIGFVSYFGENGLECVRP